MQRGQEHPINGQDIKTSAFDSQAFHNTIEREHRAAREQRHSRRAQHEPSDVPDRFMPRSGRSFRDTEIYQHAYLAIGPAQGALLYMLARAANARHIVEFGSSFGISTLYLAAAAADNDGHVIGSEFHDNKRAHALQNLTDAGLSDRVEIRAGDAMESLSDIDAGIEFLFLDGEKGLYQPILDMLRPGLSDRAIVVADNLDHFAGENGDFRERILADTDFTTRLIPVGRGGMFSVSHAVTDRKAHV